MLQITLLYVAILFITTAYETHLGDGKGTLGVVTPLPYSLYAMEIVSFIILALPLLLLRRRHGLAIIPWLTCSALSVGLFVYWLLTMHWIKSDHGSVIEFLQFALGAHNYDRFDPSLESMWPTFWRSQIPFVLAVGVGFALTVFVGKLRARAKD